VRLCKANRLRYRNCDMSDLEAKLKEAASARLKMIATDGVFSMDGFFAPLKEICALAERYEAMVMVDDSHATGFVGRNGRGTPEHNGVEGKIDVITSTFGKALGGASGGFSSGRAVIVKLLRQRSRPYLFSNTVAPMIAAATLETLKLLGGSDSLRLKLNANTTYFREMMTKAGFEVKAGSHPIVPVMLGDAKLAKTMADELLKEGIYVIGFSYPVVPKGQARIRVQISAAHEREHLDKALAAFTKVGRRQGVVR
jgi:glycine C-acetyltransferase